jgi:multicomponent Na+:H+ antiporter subunit D
MILHPALILVLGALVLPWLPRSASQAAVIGLPLAALWAVWQVPDGAVWQLHFLDYTLTPLAGDKLTRLFATIFSLMAAVGGCTR